MSVIGKPTAWANFFEPLMLNILEVVIASWEEMPMPTPDTEEDKITISLLRSLQRNRTARNLPFQIRGQLVELDPAPGQSPGRMDIVFIPPLNREDIYFCLEAKRLNAITNGDRRAYASEYIKEGMLRFVTGQYSQSVPHGGMIGYVLDGDLKRAVRNVRANIRNQYRALRMEAPGVLMQSGVLTCDNRAKETRHPREHETTFFRIHHLFMAVSAAQP